MIIKIPDELTPTDRNKFIKNHMFAYALCKFDFDRKKAADWLGITVRAVHIKMKYNQVFVNFLNTYKETAKEREENYRFYGPECRQMWADTRKKLIAQFMKTFDYHQMTEEQRQNVIDTINRTYQ